MLNRRCASLLCYVCLILGLSASVSAAIAETVESFYSGKTIRLLIGFGPGGGYDIYARAVARHLGRHIPGNPAVVPQNMAGAGGIRASGYIYNVAPKDGTTIGMVSRGTAMDSLLGSDAKQFDARRFEWIGSVTDEASVCAFSSVSGIKNWSDMLSKDSSVGSSGATDDTAIYANLVRSMFHAKMKLISGYPGTTEMMLAVERNELNGICGWSWNSLKARYKARYEAKEIAATVQLSLSAHEDLADVPLIMSLTKDPTALAALRVILSRQTMARPFVAPPGIPDDRKDALRKAFDATMKDPEFLQEARRLDLEVRPVSGAKIDELLTNAYQTPPNILQVAAEAIRSAP